MQTAEQSSQLNHFLEFIMARKASTFSLTNMLAKRRDEMADARARMKRLQDNAPAFRAAIHVANMVADYAQEIDFTQWSYVDTYIGHSAQELTVSLEGTVDSLKTGAVVDMLERALACGFEDVGSKDYLSEYASQRSFRFSQVVAGVKIDLKIVANIKAASEACRKVRVGTKLEEVAQYELVCS
jgi:hypothetical protein